MEQAIAVIRDNLVSFVFAVALLALTGLTTWSLTGILTLREDMVVVKKELSMKNEFSSVQNTYLNQILELRLQQVSNVSKTNNMLLQELETRIVACERRDK